MNTKKQLESSIRSYRQQKKAGGDWAIRRPESIGQIIVIFLILVQIGIRLIFWNILYYGVIIERLKFRYTIEEPSKKSQW